MRLFSAAALAVFMAGASSAHADDIFYCKDAKGQFFWSSFACSQHQGTTVDVLKVPELNFREQLLLAVAARQHPYHKVRTSANDPVDRPPDCDGIDKQLVEIWSRYRDGGYIPAEQYGQDRLKGFELRNRRGQLAC